MSVLWGNGGESLSPIVSSEFDAGRSLLAVGDRGSLMCVTLIFQILAICLKISFCLTPSPTEHVEEKYTEANGRLCHAHVQFCEYESHFFTCHVQQVHVEKQGNEGFGCNECSLGLKLTRPRPLRTSLSPERDRSKQLVWK